MSGQLFFKIVYDGANNNINLICHDSFLCIINVMKIYDNIWT